ncbi:hypothetical protein Tco_1562456 [Tanacetum coccineum]
MNGYLWLRLMRLAKKVGGTVEVSESLRGKLVKTMWEEVSCCRTSCIYSGEEDQSFSIQSSLKSKMACAKWGMSRCRLARTLVTSVIDQMENNLLLKKSLKKGIVDQMSRTTNCNYGDQCVVPSANKDVIQFIGLECCVFRLSNKVMAISVISGLSDSSEESVGTSTGEDETSDILQNFIRQIENQLKLSLGASEVTNSAGTSQTPSSNASEEKDEDVELIVVPSTVKTTEDKG